MYKIKHFKLVIICCIISLAFAACKSAKEIKTEEKTFSYQFTVNGCATGQKTFSDLAAYCAALKNNAENKYCAENERLQLYSRDCNSVAPQKLSPENSEVEENQEVLRPSPQTPAQALEEPLSLKDLLIIAHPESPLRISPQPSGEFIVSALEGNLIIDSLEPLFKQRLKIDQAEEITFIGADLGQCELHIKQFKAAANLESIHFTLMGTDKKNQIESSGCMTKLSSIAMTGFTVEFKNVPVGGALSQQTVQKVTLKLKIK
ncbi:MAG TPA: hypothetical protein VIG33_12840 [Pseudobdellovibrionaceae bacterium]|jgi:hypothetical protein